jgi:hypothetical protein
MTKSPARIHLTVAGLSFALSAVVVAGATAAAFGKLNDFYREAWPAYAALGHGHPIGFLRLGPAYIGSLVLRAPFAVVPKLWTSGAAASYVASAIPCLLALAVFCAWMAAQRRRSGAPSWVGRIGLIIWCVFAPAILTALLGGHPEEILGAVLCVGAVVLATQGRAGWAGFLVGLAVINKPWAIVAVPVVVAVAPAGRPRALLVAAATAGAVLIPIFAIRAIGAGGQAAGLAAGTSIGNLFNPPQLLWWLGSHSWIVQQARLGIVLVAVACAGLWLWLRTKRGAGIATELDALMLLALILFLRAALDPWNNIYYHVPFLLALMAYEVRSGRAPLLTVFYAVLLEVIVPLKGVPHMSHDLRAAIYAAFAVPTIAWMGAKVYLPPTQRSARRLPHSTVAADELAVA